MSNQWYPKYPGDYGRDTGHLTMLEHGAYNLLLDHYYSTNKPLPGDVGKCHRVARAIDVAEQEAVSTVLAQFFNLRDGHYHNDRADAEIEKSDEISEKRRLAGIKGAKATHRDKPNANTKAMASGMANDMANANTTTTTTTTTPTTTATPTEKEQIKASFDRCWEKFGKYGVEKKAMEYWTALKPEDRVQIEDNIPPYIRCVAAGRTKKQFELWINPANRHWDMDWTEALKQAGSSNGTRQPEHKTRAQDPREYQQTIKVRRL